MKRLLLLACLFCLGASAQNLSTSGTISAASTANTCTATSCVYYQLPSGATWVTLQIAGTWSGSVGVYSITSQNATYQNLNSQTWTQQATLTANGTWAIAAGNSTFILVQSSSFSSGDANITMTASSTGSPLVNPILAGNLTVSGINQSTASTSGQCWSTQGGVASCGYGPGTVIPISSGGTGASTSSAALTNLFAGVTCSTGQAYSPASGTCVSPAGVPGGTNGQVQYNNNGAFGGATPDTDLYFPQNYTGGVNTVELESGGTVTAQYGCYFAGDSNGVGLGMPPSSSPSPYVSEGEYYSWAGRLAVKVQCPQPWAGVVSTWAAANSAVDFSGDGVMDYADRTFLNVYPTNGGNPFFVSNIGTNDLRRNTTSTPSTAISTSFESGMAATDSYASSTPSQREMFAAQPATATSYAVTGNGGTSYLNLVTVQAANAFIPGQSFCFPASGAGSWSTAPANGLNGKCYTVAPIALNGQEYSFYATIATHSSQSDTGVANPSIVWTQSGTWTSGDFLAAYGFQVTTNKGIGYQVGNLLSDTSCTVRPAIYKVTNVTTAPGSGLTFNITTTSGVITGVTLVTGGTGYTQPEIVGVTGGNSDAVLSLTVNLSTGVVTALTILQGGTGYSNASNVTATYDGVLDSQGSLSYPLVQNGIGCTSATTAIPVSCSVGTGTACGHYAQWTTLHGQQILSTSTGGTLTSPSIAVPLPESGTTTYVHVWYPVEGLWTGSFQFLVDGVAATDTWTGSSTINQACTGCTPPYNFSSGSGIMEARFPVTGGVSHTFTLSCISGGLCGAIGISIPTIHQTGSDLPAVFQGGTYPAQNTLTYNTCGSTNPNYGCVQLYDGYISNAVDTLAADGYRVKKFSNSNVDPVTDFYGTLNGTSQIVQGCISNNTPPLHMDSCGHEKVANNALQAAKAQTGQSQQPTFNNGIVFPTSPAKGDYTTIGNVFGVGQLPNYGNASGNSDQATVFLTPQGFAWDNCYYTGVTNGLNPWPYNPSAIVNCTKEETDLSSRMLAQGNATSSVSYSSYFRQYVASTWNAGIQLSITGGSGYTGSYSPLAFTGGTYSVPAVGYCNQTSGVVNCYLTNAGVYTVAPTACAMSGGNITGGTGFSCTASLVGGKYENHVFNEALVTNGNGPTSQPLLTLQDNSPATSGAYSGIEFKGFSGIGYKFLFDNPANALATFSDALLTTGVTLQIPNCGTCALAGLSYAQTWTALQTFSSGLTGGSSRKGTFVCTAGGTITVSNSNELATSDVVISLNTAGGTITTPPAMKTVTAGTGFTVLCGASDTSTYNYDILN